MTLTVIFFMLTSIINLTQLTSQPTPRTSSWPSHTTQPPLAHQRCFSTNAQACLNRCHCASDDVCDSLTGACPNGCAVGWSGVACELGNVALNKTATQTNAANIGGDNRAGNCIDGSLSTDPAQNTCCAVVGSDTEGQEFWELDLGDDHVINRVAISPSNNDTGAIRNLNVMLLSNRQVVDTQRTSDDWNDREDVIFTTLQVANRVRIQKIRDSRVYKVVMCEVSVIGYPYIECAQYEGNYFYGPACMHDCGCDVAQQCNYITGVVSCTCKAGYIHSSSKCEPCTRGVWGSKCRNTCNCLDNNEICHHVDGNCPKSGCKQWHAGRGCDRQLPRLGDSVVPDVSVDGKTISIRVVLTANTRRRRAAANHEIVYKIGYRQIHESNNVNADDDLMYLDAPLQPDDDGSFTGAGRLPTLRERYSVCVVPYDVVVDQEGERSRCVAVWTQCANGEYGTTDCNKLCTCRERSEVCDKETGECNGCNDGITGLDCKLRIPDESVVLVNFVSRTTDIEIIIETYVQYVVEYKATCTDANGHNHTQLMQANQSNEPTVVGIISNLQSSTEYLCFVLPVLFDDHGTYLGVELHLQNVTTSIQAADNSSSTGDKSNTISVVVGTVVVLVVAVVVGAAGIVWLRRKRSKRNESANTKIIGERNTDEENYVNGNVRRADDEIYENAGVQIDDVSQGPQQIVEKHDVKPEKKTKTIQIPPEKKLKPALPAKKPAPPQAKSFVPTVKESYLPIKLKDFAQYMAKFNSEDYNLSAEFNDIPEGSAPCKTGEKPGNSEKHRFLNIKAYDHSRVKLVVPEGAVSDSDYVNACYIRDYHGNRTVIASQAPRVPTIDDTWRMIWQENVNQIVMLTKLKEGDKVKCQRYWPVEGNEQYGEVTVELLSVDSNSCYIERRMRVTKDEEARMVTHLQYTNWPDHGVPDSAHEVLYLYYKVKSLEQSRTGRLLVHCSAGVGRTGTFIGLEWLLEQSRSVDSVDVVKCVRSMREDRTQMVQNIHQYRFLYQLLHEALTLGNTTITNDNYKSFMVATSHEVVINNQLLHINKIYQPTAAATDCSDALRPENIGKTRGGADCAPANSSRLFLSTPVSGHNDYINAVRCHSFNKKNNMMMTQLPPPDTVADMWRLVYDHSACAIVLLDDIPSDEVPYWPTVDSTEMSFGTLAVKFVNEFSKMYDGVTVRDFTVQHRNSPGDVRKVRQWHLTSWGKSDSSVSPTVLKVLVDLSTQYANKMTAGTTIVQCLDGVNRSSLYVAYNNLLEMMTSTKTIDVCFVARQIRSIRPQAIQSVEQLQLLYKWMDDTMSDIQEYYN